MTDIDHMIAVMTAAKEGKAIQSRLRAHRDIDEFWSYAPRCCACRREETCAS